MARRIGGVMSHNNLAFSITSGGKLMRTLKACLVLLVTIAMAMAAPVLAQMPAQPTNTIVQIYSSHPKPGMMAQYEAGRKRHMAWHKAQKDTWGWNVWEVISGNATGG